MAVRDVVVVGAGPAGLAVTACLNRRGVTPLVLEAGPVAGWSWARARHKGLRLHTARRFSALPGLPIDRSAGQWVSAVDLARYLQAYAKRLDGEFRWRSPVTEVRKAGPHWVVRCAQAEYPAKSVVFATGLNRHARKPALPGRERFGGSVLHSQEYVDADSLEGRDVTVVGMGNSGADIAMELARDPERAVALSVRTPPHILPATLFGMPSQYMGVAFGWMPDALLDLSMKAMRRAFLGDLSRHGLPVPGSSVMATIRREKRSAVIDTGVIREIRRERISVLPAVEGFYEGGLLLADGRRHPSHAVILATGYETGLRGLLPPGIVLDAQDVPAANGSAERLPGLFFLGYASSARGVLFDVGRQARPIATAVATRLRALDPQTLPGALST